jgi:hypothetical protein
MRDRQIAINLIASMLLLFTIPALAQTPADLDKFTGDYRATSILMFYILRDGSELHARVSGHKNELVLLPLNANKFTESGSGAQFIFSRDGRDMISTASKLPMVYRQRLHSALDYLSPEEYEQKLDKSSWMTPDTSSTEICP